MLDPSFNFVININTDKLADTLSSFLNDVKPHLQKSLDAGIVGSGINNLANELALVVRAVHNFFSNVNSLCSAAISSAFAAIGGLSSTALSKILTLGKTTVPLTTTSVGTVIVFTGTAIAVAGLAYFSYTSYNAWRKRREEEKNKRRIISEKQNELDKIKQKILSLIENPDALNDYFRKGTFVRELFSITGILPEEIKRFKGQIKTILKSLQEFGYGRENTFYRSQWLTKTWLYMRRDIMGQKLPSDENFYLWDWDWDDEFKNTIVLFVLL